MNDLSTYFSKESWTEVSRWIEKARSNYRIQIKVVADRKSKLGDYRCFSKENRHEITINKNLSKGMFLLVFTHEWAHFCTRLKYGNKVQPHGRQWKDFFRILLNKIRPTIEQKELLAVIDEQIKSPRANLASSEIAMRYFSESKTGIKATLLKDIPMKSSFTHRGRTYRKLDKIKMRYICKDELSGKRFLISGKLVLEQYENRK